MTNSAFHLVSVAWEKVFIGKKYGHIYLSRNNLFLSSKTIVLQLCNKVLCSLFYSIALFFQIYKNAVD